MPTESEAGWLDGRDPEHVPTAVREAYGELATAEGDFGVRPLSGGLLHESLHVRLASGDFVLQRVSDVFDPAIHDNIEAVTRHLRAHGIPAPTLVRTREGGLFADLGALGRWRLMQHLGGQSFARVRSVAQSHSAGLLVGRFHAALRDFDRPLAPMGIPYRDTPRYLEQLRNAMETHRAHRLAPSMRPLGERILSAFETLGAPPEVSDRVIHGDLKLSNLLFEASPDREGAAFALVDFDTLMRGPLWVELGDAWRSWCNRAADEGSQPRFDLEVFEASMRGFVAGYDAPLEAGEWRSLESAPERITLELATRFVTDAFEETYWGWDPDHYATRGDHNAARAEAQWRLFEAILEVRAERAEILRSLS